MEGKWSSWRVEVEDSVGDFGYRISRDLMINIVVLVSMMVQLLLAFGGAIRYRSGSSALQLLIWLGYMSADAVAIYALGVMAQTQNRAILFGIWAPILLSHLGGPDTICAYSTPDNELWSRHLLTMLYQILVAGYIVYSSQLEGRLLAAALLLLIVGIYKYSERIIALRSSSFSQIVSSADPMNDFIGFCDRGRCNYLVMGLKQRKKSPNAIVTINDVWNSEGNVATENYLLCLSHALFKMNKRRYVNLYLRERYYNTTRDFYFSEYLSHIPSAVTPQKIFALAEMELKFMYDLLFSKSSGTAFSKAGTVMRLVNICLMGITGFLIDSVLSSQRVAGQTLSVQRMVAYVLLSVSLVSEIVQFCRILASDWTMVWLICTRIQHSRGRRNQKDSYMTKLMEIAIRVSSCFRKYCPGGYWKTQISQYSIIDTSSHISPSIWKLTKSLRLTSLVTDHYTYTEPIGDDLKTIIVDKLKERCSSEKGDVENCRKQLESFDFSLEENNCKDLKWASEPDHEHLILHWHIATTICEMQREAESAEAENIKSNVRISGKLSRYCAYLLVSTPKLLPLHPDMAEVNHMDVHSELIRLHDIEYNRVESYEGNTTLGKGAQLARELQQKSEQQRWKIISDFWCGVIIYYALKNKATTHAERLTVGGEFLTLLWAIVGHIGVGDQY